MGLAGRENFLGHIYCGPSVPDDNMGYLLRLEERPGIPDGSPGERASFYDCFPFEYPAWGGGNFREPCLRVETANGGGNCELFYESHRIFHGKPGLEGLPACYGENSSTLEITLKDPALELKAHLLYTVFEDVDAVCRSVRVENCGSEALELTDALSACPSHVNGRVTPFEIRGRVSLPGCFGYELNIDKLFGEEQALIPKQLEEYRKFGPVFREGDYYRLASCRENGAYDAIMAVTKDKATAVVSFVQVKSRAYRRSLRLRLAGLEERALYRRADTGEVHTGTGWMRGGLLMEAVQSDYASVLTVLEQIAS